MHTARYLAIFTEVLKGMKNDTVLLHTSRGRFILELFKHLEESSDRLNSPIATEICAKLESCLPPERDDLPSNAADQMWSQFHKLRLCANMYKSWDKYLHQSDASSHLHEYSKQSLQVIMDRVFKYLIANRNASASCPEENHDIKLSEREQIYEWLHCS